MNTDVADNATLNTTLTTKMKAEGAVVGTAHACVL
jgi:hypothetical protein